MTKFLIELILLLLLVVAIAICIWNAIPTILKIIAVILIVVGFFKMLQSK